VPARARANAGVFYTPHLFPFIKPVAHTTPLWLFDLDNTLHNASHAIFPAINANMNGYIGRILAQAGLACDTAAVNALRQDYWRRYGATLAGMVRHHGVRTEDFLREAHRFDNLAQMIRTERGLAHLLKRLPGRKILLTNAPRAYAANVVRHLRLHPHFSKHISIESMQVHRQLRPKPSRQFLRKLLVAQRVAARRCILVEDTVENLKAAKQMGMRTVWMTAYLRSPPLAGMMQKQVRLLRRPGYVDYRVESLYRLARTAVR
jgi:putative hydrolase of the HAD superfamily